MINLLEHCIIPDWPAPKSVRALQTTRQGGYSVAPYDSLNLGEHVGDSPLVVARNRQLLSALLPSEPVWLNQVHGTGVIDVKSADCYPRADASLARHRGMVCVVMTADCLPVLLCDENGSVVGAVHAGWRGLCAGVIEQTVMAMAVSPQSLMAWLGPSIGQQSFEVGDEVRNAFLQRQSLADSAFMPSSPDNSSLAAQGRKWLADIGLLARLRLQSLGIFRIYGGGRCTYSTPLEFFSYRREGITGRMATFIWLE